MKTEDIEKRALPLARDLAAYACDNADPDSDPKLVTEFQAAIAAFGKECFEAGLNYTPTKENEAPTKNSPPIDWKAEAMLLASALEEYTYTSMALDTYTAREVLARFKKDTNRE